MSHRSGSFCFPPCPSICRSGRSGAEPHEFLPHFAAEYKAPGALSRPRCVACQKSVFDKLSNETRFTGLSFEKAAARCSARRARPSHVCEPSGIFSDVHAAGENDFYFLCACERKLCEAFIRQSDTARWDDPTGRFFRFVIASLAQQGVAISQYPVGLWGSYRRNRNCLPEIPTSLRSSE